MLRIGDFSKLSRISIRMLRHYDELGLLRPTETDPFSGYRYYSEKQLPIACRIVAMKEMGFGLSAIHEILEAQTPDMLEALLLAHRQELLAQADEAVKRLRLLDTAIERLRKEEHMHYDVLMKTIPERTAACVRMTIPTYDHEGMLWGMLTEETAALRIVPDDPCLCCALFYDAEFKEHDVDVEIQKTVRGSYPDTEHVRFRVLPAVQVASTVHRGSYAEIAEAYSATLDWISANHYVCSGPMFNIYHVSPHESANPDEFVTEICMPIAKE